ncbi:hypothetical protein KVR01_010674 [Diaporthe batatas]|uniref:uncharacterized protein n=1 Tax=Diaporthe batatas TaxID=748121 RepID=UPI001D0362C2|nr:uncharacterized protein KVR01_010674 [Diaporthe batatas]KAG8160037.1 hypothetical protein KVR01_010674 [Diaporthe batatas]
MHPPRSTQLRCCSGCGHSSYYIPHDHQLPPCHRARGQRKKRKEKKNHAHGREGVHEGPSMTWPPTGECSLPANAPSNSSTRHETRLVPSTTGPMLPSNRAPQGQVAAVLSRLHPTTCWSWSLVPGRSHTSNRSLESRL